MSPEYVFLGIISALLFGIIFFVWYSRYKKINNIGSGFGLQLFLISIPESKKTGENPTEALKNFISEMEKFISGFSGLKAGILRRVFGVRRYLLLKLPPTTRAMRYFFTSHSLGSLRIYFKISSMVRFLTPK